MSSTAFVFGWYFARKYISPKHTTVKIATFYLSIINQEDLDFVKSLHCSGSNYVNIIYLAQKLIQLVNRHVVLGLCFFELVCFGRWRLSLSGLRSRENWGLSLVAWMISWLIDIGVIRLLKVDTSAALLSGIPHRLIKEAFIQILRLISWLALL